MYMPVKRKYSEKIQKVVMEIMKEIDFDIESLFETDPKETDMLIKHIVISTLKEDEIPRIEWINVVTEYDAEKLKDDYGDFVLN